MSSNELVPVDELSDYEREVIDCLIWRKYRFSYVEANRGSRLKLLADAQAAVDPKLNERKLMSILRKPAAKKYAREMKENLRALAMKRLKDATPEAVDAYFWARKTAEAEGDYRETHKQAADHLDRIGASEKRPDAVVQVATVVLRSRNFSEDNLLKPSPELLGEAEPDAPDAEQP